MNIKNVKASNLLVSYPVHRNRHKTPGNLLIHRELLDYNSVWTKHFLNLQQHDIIHWFIYVYISHRCLYVKIMHWGVYFLIFKVIFIISIYDDFMFFFLYRKWSIKVHWREIIATIAIIAGPNKRTRWYL